MHEKKNDQWNENFEKHAISEAKTMEFGRKTMNLLRGPICWPISNRKVAPIEAKLNFGTKKKQASKEKFLKNPISEAETMEFGWKMKNLLRSPICWPISNRKVAPI